MNKAQTLTASSALALGATAVGIAVDRRLGARPYATALAVAAASAYLRGTFFPSARIFGASVQAGEVDRAFALTFDDGPDPRYTVEISQLLAERGHQATFFVLARAVRAYPDIAAAVLSDCHELACHGDDHRLLAFASPSEVRRQISAAERAVAAATGSSPTPLFRAPHGVRSPWLSRVVHQAGYRVCAWDGRVFDTAQPGVQVIASRVERLLRPGAIVLLHDGDGSGRRAPRRQTVAALPEILDAAERRGLRSVGVGALLGAS
jgi:peptidoglycan/xylan/chitin deacetylase (PgdA/CDA1 family)